MIFYFLKITIFSNPASKPFVSVFHLYQNPSSQNEETPQPPHPHRLPVPLFSRLLDPEPEWQRHRTPGIRPPRRKQASLREDLHEELASDGLPIHFRTRMVPDHEQGLLRLSARGGGLREATLHPGGWQEEAGAGGQQENAWTQHWGGRRNILLTKPDF